MLSGSDFCLDQYSSSNVLSRAGFPSRRFFAGIESCTPPSY